MDDKRAIDLAIGIPIAIAATPILALCSLALITTSGWPPVIIQVRVGANEQPIRVPKLRTMVVGTPIMAKSALPSEYRRLIPLGAFLRRTSLDELPQIFSVLRGDMSLIGPRPALPSQEDLLTLRRRHNVTADKPGLTGLAQVLGRESLTLATKVRSEALYRRRRSLRLDLLILVLIVRAVLFGRGAY